ncbi:MAG TPA: mannonate dehydratase [Haploplasma sp.]|nr:mannonate dehydratase [Haploplasma sp.]
MKMTLRWFGKDHDSVTLEQIRQIPGVTGVITTLYDTKPGEVWSVEAIAKLKKEVEDAGLLIEGIESVNIHDAIKIGSADRDMYIDNYIQTLENLAANDIRLVCYNFMPVFDWTRSDLAKDRPDGSNVLSYDQELIDKIDPNNMFQAITEKSHGFVMPGWEPERMDQIKSLFEAYKDVDAEKLFDNLVYFLNRIMPTCDKHNIDMAIHPDDPSWPVFGLARIINGEENIIKLMKAVDNPHNGVTFCSGSFGSNPKNNLVDIIHALEGRIHFAHIRNIVYLGEKKFDEAAHLSSDGSLDMHAILKALHDTGFTGPMRPDHGRAVWGEISMPGYGLYDRAMGATYLNGLWEAITKSSK